MYTTFSEETWRAFRADNRPGPIHMLNLIRLRERAEYADGRLASGLEAYAEYSRISAAPARALGMSIAWRGGFELMMIGPVAEHWDHCFVAEYPEVEAFINLMRHPEYREAMIHRQAGVEDSRLVRLKPLEAGTTFAGPTVPLADL
jgi:uncharacterized protein (DUF1330 family)